MSRLWILLLLLVIVACEVKSQGQDTDLLPLEGHATRYTSSHWLRLCAGIGELVESFVRSRDNGMPLTSALQMHRANMAKNPNALSVPVGSFVEGFILELYTKRYWDTVEARRQAETQCMAMKASRPTR